MVKILFVCHGNICRSPMAEFVMKDLVKREGIADQFMIASAATSREEIGNPVHPGTKRKLKAHGIACDGKYARQLTKEDGKQYDYLIGMETYNLTNMKRIVGNDAPLCRLLDFSKHPRDIADPWYTENFDLTYRDIVEGCDALLQYLYEHNKINMEKRN